MSQSEFNTPEADLGYKEGVLNQPKSNFVYDDFDFSVGNLTQRAGGKPDKDYNEDEWLFDDSSVETVVGSKITKHKFKIKLTSEEITAGDRLIWYPHIHWIQEAIGNPIWELKYKLCPAGEAEGAWVTIAGSTQEFDYASGSLHQINVLQEIDVTDLLNTAVEVKIQVSRLGDNPLDDYVGDARFCGFDFHVPIDQDGSRTQFVK